MVEWRDRGVVLGVRLHGETSVVLDLLTAEHGRHAGLVRGGRSRRLRPILQPGNGVTASWHARLEDQLGRFQIEAGTARAASAFDSARALQAIHHLTALARLLPERDPHPLLHAMLDAMMEEIEAEALPRRVLFFELQVLADLGFGLDLARCAVTGRTTDLAHVSPKTGRAVSTEAAGPYADRLLPLPPFLRPDAEDLPVSPDDLARAFRLTEHFLRRDLFGPRGLRLPDARQAFLTLSRIG